VPFHLAILLPFEHRVRRQLGAVVAESLVMNKLLRRGRSELEKLSPLILTLHSFDFFNLVIATIYSIQLTLVDY
jgi:hypothetical protein